MVARNTHRKVPLQPSTVKPARNIGKAFVRPGALARYVDAQKISNFSLLKALGKRNTATAPSQAQRSSTSAKDKVMKSHHEEGSSRLLKYAPNVDITRKSKSGKRVRSYLTDKQLKFQYATVPTPRGIGRATGSQSLAKGFKGQGKQQGQGQGQGQKTKGKRPGVSSRLHSTKTQRTPMSPKLISLPSDILTRVLCCMQHQEIPPLMNVCRGLADAAKIAITTHFNFLTPDPKRVAYHHQKKPTRAVPSHSNASTSMGLKQHENENENENENEKGHSQRVFGSASQPTPMAPRQKRRSRRFSHAKRRKGSKIKKRSLVFDETTETTTTTSGSSGSGSDSGNQ